MRTRKQIIYGAFYLSVLFLIGFVYFISQSGDGDNGCVGCKDAPTDLRIIYEDFFVVGDSVSALAEIRNDNQDFSADNLTYELSFLDEAGSKIAEHSGKAGIAPGETRTVYAIGRTDRARETSRVSVLVKNVTWSPGVSESAPDFTLERELKVEIKKGRIVVSGEVTGSSGASDLEAIVVGRDALGFRVGVSGTIVREFAPGEIRTFSVEFPFDEKFAEKLKKGRIEMFFYPVAL